MSQSGALSVKTGGGAVTETLTGNSGGPVGPDGAFNINILGNNSSGINVVGNPGTSTLTVVGIQSTTTQQGTITLATNAQAIAGTDTMNAVTSAALAAKLGTQTAHSLAVFEGTSSALTALGVATNGQLPIGSTGADPVLGNITSTGGTITVTNGAGTINIDVAASTHVIETITGNTGGAESPLAGNFNILGTGSITVAGSANTETVQLTGLTNHSLQVGAGSATLTQLGVATNGQLPIGSAGADPVLATLTAGTGISITNGAGSISIAVNGSAVGETITGNSGGALSPTAGNWNILGASTAAGTTPVTTVGSGSTLTVDVQKAQAIAATDATKVGLANFNSSDFSVDANGFVAAASTGYIRTITGTSGGAESPAAGGNFSILGGTAAAGTTPVVVAGTANTETVKVQISQAIASTDATKIGLAAFNSADFTVDVNGFVSTVSGSAGIATVNGDSGSISGSTVTIYANNAANTCGSSVLFVNSGTTSTLNVTDSNSNTIFGKGAGTSASGIQNAIFGASAFANPGNAGESCAFGYQSLNAYSGGSALAQNCGFGWMTLYQLTTGNNNYAFGWKAGGNYTSTESFNIVIGHSGVIGDSGVIRIGNPSGQTTCYIAGIEGVAVSNLNMVTINTSTGQLGSQAFTIPALTVTAVNHAASPYTVLAANQFLAVDVSGGVVTIKLPNAPTTGRIIYIKDSTGAAATSNISVTTVGGTVTIDGQTTYTMATNYQSLSVIFDGTNYEVF